MLLVEFLLGKDQLPERFCVGGRAGEELAHLGDDRARLFRVSGVNLSVELPPKLKPIIGNVLDFATDLGTKLHK